MLRLFVLLLVLFAPRLAWGGAFLQAPEHGQVIAQLGFSEAGRGYDSSGRAVAIPAWRKFELSTYAEYGLTDWLTVIGSPSWFRFHAPTPQPTNYYAPLPGRTISRPGAAEVGARVRIYAWDDCVLSAQASVRYSAGGASVECYVDMNRRAQVDLRLLFGRAIELMGMQGYADGQIAFRTHGPFGHQARFDMTFALRPFERTTLMLQSFTALTPGRLGDRFALSQKVQASVLFDVTDSLSLQLGALIALRGVNVSAERGLVSGVWWRF